MSNPEEKDPREIEALRMDVAQDQAENLEKTARLLIDQQLVKDVEFETLVKYLASGTDEKISPLAYQYPEFSRVLDQIISESKPDASDLSPRFSELKSQINDLALDDEKYRPLIHGHPEIFLDESITQLRATALAYRAYKKIDPAEEIAKNLATNLTKTAIALETDVPPLVYELADKEQIRIQAALKEVYDSGEFDQEHEQGRRELSTEQDDIQGNLERKELLKRGLRVIFNQFPDPKELVRRLLGELE